MKYPKAIKQECGCKVSWLYYDNQADAERASDIAEAEAIELEKEGFDWGYQTPGAIEYNPTQNLYRVTTP